MKLLTRPTSLGVAALAASVLTSFAPAAAASAAAEHPSSFPHVGPLAQTVLDPAGDVVTLAGDGRPHRPGAGDAVKVTYQTLFAHPAYETAFRVRVELAKPHDQWTRFATRVVTQDGRQFVIRAASDTLRLICVEADGSRRVSSPIGEWAWGYALETGPYAQVTLPASVFGSAGLTRMRTVVVRGDRATVDQTAAAGPLRLTMIR